MLTHCIVGDSTAPAIRQFANILKYSVAIYTVHISLYELFAKTIEAHRSTISHNAMCLTFDFWCEQ